MTKPPSTFARVSRYGVAGAAAVVVAGAAFALPAAATQSGSASVANDTLTITGTSRADNLALLLAPGAPGTLQVDFGADGSAEFSFDRTTFSRIEVNLRSGADVFNVNQANGVFADEPITVDGGSGSDTLNGGDNIEQFFGGSGRDSVDGNRGNDTAYLGSGQDSFRWDPGDGSDVVEGDSGFDTLDFNGAPGAEQMSMFPEGPRAVFFRVQANIRMDMDNVEHLDLAALGGVDTFDLSDMSGTDMRVSDVDLSNGAGAGDGQPDVVTVNAPAGRRGEIEVEADDGAVEVEGRRSEVRITGPETIDVLQINARGGEVEVDDDAEALMTVLVAQI